jgi:hypothetical protein
MELRLGAERFLTRFSLTLFFLASLCFLLASSSWAQQEGPSDSEQEDLLAWKQKTQPEKEEFFIFGQATPAEDEELPTLKQETLIEKSEFLAFGERTETKRKKYLSRGQKTLLLNSGAMVGIFIYGLTRWDYGKSSFSFKNERWFERDTKYGGADKLGHFWSSYAMSHLFSYVYRKWRYTESEANLYGALSNLGFQTFMEICDGFSPSQGFSYEDILMNIAGTGIAYVWGRYPSLARKIDFRIEYTPEFNSRDFGFSTNYERQRFLIALKADGFNFIRNPYLRYLEFHIGYYARGYKEHEEGGPETRRRHLYVGLGFNVSKLVQKFVHTTVFDYFQIPYTSVTGDVTSDER